MNVGQLIKQLKKLDPKIEVGFQDHDSDEYMISSWVRGVRIIDFDNIPERQISENEWNCKGEIAALHS